MRAYTIALLLTLLAGCGPSPDKAAKPDVLAELNAELPKCTDVWIIGKRLPDDYEGCMSEPDVLEAAVSTCDGRMLTYEAPGHGFFIDRDRTILDGGDGYADDPRYAALLEGC